MMKRLLAGILTCVLTGSLIFGLFNSNLIVAHADEATADTAAQQEALPPAEAAAVQSEVSGVESFAGSPEEPSVGQASEGASAPAASEVPVEEPYWVSDVVYSQLLSEYDALAAGADGTSIIVDATLVITSQGGGLQSTIKVGATKVLRSGTNSPSYDNGSALLLTEKEGYPQAGTSSTQSLLRLIESREGARVYEATFFFGSNRYPEAPFTAFRTFVVLEGEDNVDSGLVEDEREGNVGSVVEEVVTTPEGGSPSTGIESPSNELDSPALGNTAVEEALLRPSPSLIAMSSLFSARAIPDDIYPGYTFTLNLTWVGNWNGSMSNGWFTAEAWWGSSYLSFDIACLNPYLFGPESLNYSGQAMQCRVDGIDRMNGLVRLSVWVPAPYPNSQSLGSSPVISVPFYGDIELVKKSANTSITEGNSCYDLAGAEYGLYRSWSDAYNNVSRIHTFTSNSAGKTNRATGLVNGYYYVKELVAPKGYELDGTIYTVTHDSALTTVTRTDVPYNDPVLLLVQKIDAATGEAYGKDDPNGYLLADAEFTVRYWDAYFDTIEEAEISGEPTRTWVFKTQQNGRAALSSSLLLNGSDPLYFDYGNATVPLGTIAIQETTPPPGYLLPDPNPVSLQQVNETGNPLAPFTRLNTVTVLEEPHEVVAQKVDSNTNQPIANTEFTLYKESASGAGGWTVVSSHVTNEEGKCVFSPVAVGSYKLDETRANPLYAELQESGDDAHYFEITPQSTEEVQVFQNDLIQVAIEVYKKTIPLTNTALDGTNDQAQKHVGLEEYLYHFGACSNSNVRVDEFVVTDSLEYVTSKGYRMTSLWTGTSPEGMDFDGLMHILYKTNMTDSSEAVSFSYNPMSANPSNANNPDNNMSVSIEPGWRVWQECVSTTSAIRLEVAGLNLREGEYIVGLRAVYGGVAQGFVTGAGWGLTDGTSELRDWSYSVIATDALLTIGEMGDETVMRGSVQADLFRNWGTDAPVLTDVDHDKVETRVIETFKYGKQSLGIKPGGFMGGFGLPITGDSMWMIVLGLAIVTTAAITLVVAAAKKRRRNKTEEG